MMTESLSLDEMMAPCVGMGDGCGCDNSECDSWRCGGWQL